MALLKIIDERKLELSMKNDRKIIAKKLKNHQRKRYCSSNTNVRGPATRTLLPSNANVRGTGNANVAILKDSLSRVGNTYYAQTQGQRRLEDISIRKNLNEFFFNTNF